MAGEVQEDVTLMAHLRAQDEASSVVGQVSGAFRSLGGTVGALVQQGQIAAGTIGISLVGAYNTALQGAMHYSDQIQRVVFLTGMSSEKSSGLISAFRAQGFTTDEAANTMQRLTMRLGAYEQQAKSAKGMSEGTKQALADMGLSAKDLTKAGGDLSILMPKIIDHLKNMHDPLLRDRLATQLFGRNFSSIAPLIEAGGAAFRKATGDAKRFGVELSEKQMTAISNYESAVETTKEAIQGLSLQLAFQVLPVFQKVQDVIKAGIAWWNQLSPAIHKTALQVIKMTAILGPLIGGGAALQGVLLPILHTIPGVGAAAQMILGPLAGLLGFIGPLVAAFIALKYAYDHNAEVHRILLPLVTTLSNAFNHVKDAVMFFINSVGKIGPINALGGSLRILGLSGEQIVSIFTFVIGVWRNLQAEGQRLLPPLIELGRTVMAALIPAFKQIYEAVMPALRSAFVQLSPILKQLGDTFHNQIIPVILDVIEILRVVLPPVIKFLADFLSVALPIAIQIAVTAIKIFIDGFQLMWTVIKGVLDIIVDIIHGDWAKAWEDFKSLSVAVLNSFLRIFADVWDGVVRIFGGAAGTIWSAITGLWNRITKSVSDFVGHIVAQIGGFWNRIVGIWNGIVGATEAAWREFSSRPIYWVVFLVSSVVMWIVNLHAQIDAKFAQLVGLAFQFGLSFYRNAVAWIQQLPGRILGFLISVWNYVQTQAPIIVARATKMGQDFLNGVVSFISSLPGKIGGFLSGVWSSINTQAPSIIERGKKMAQDFLAAILGALASLPAKVSAVIAGAFGNAAGQAKQALHDAHVPGFAAGGIVGPHYGGPRLAMVGEGSNDEVIATMAQVMRAGALASGGGNGGGGGGAITLINNTYLDGKLISKKVSKHVGKEMRLQGGGQGSNG